MKTLGRMLALLSVFLAMPLLGQSTITGVIPQYANGTIGIVTGTVQGTSSIDSQGNFTFQVVSNPNQHNLTFTAIGGSPYPPFTITVTAGPGVTNITAQVQQNVPQIGVNLGIKNQSLIGTDSNGNAIPGSGSIGGGLSGQTPNCIPVANSTTTSNASSHLCDNGSTITSTEPVVVNDGTGVGGVYDSVEGTAPSPTAGHDIIYGDATAHCDKLSNNGGAFTCITQGSVTNITSQLTSSGCTISGGQCVVSSPVATVSFSSIPGTFTNLQISCTYNTAAVSANGLYMQFNGDTGTNYISQLLYGLNTTVGALGSGAFAVAQASFLTYPGSSGTGAYPGVASITIQNYAGTTWNKSAFATTARFLAAGSNSAVYQNATLLWANTAAITSFLIGDTTATNIVAGSTCSVYGVL